MLPAKFDSLWPSSFRGEDVSNISQSEPRIGLGGHICWWNGQFVKIYMPCNFEVNLITRLGVIALFS
jgi:hypothetical protein